MATSPGTGAQYLEPTFKRATRIWWAWVWRSILFGGAAGLFGSVVLSISGIPERVSPLQAQYLGAAVGLLLAVPVGIWVFQMILEKDFGDFRLRLVPRTPPSPPPEEAPRVPMERPMEGEDAEHWRR